MRLSPSRSWLPLASLVLGLGLLLAPGGSQAALLEGEVLDWHASETYEVWLTESLDLTGRPPLAVAPVEDLRFAIGTGNEPGEAWLFLRQQGQGPDGVPYQLFMPLSLEPFELTNPPRRIQLRGAAPQLAAVRESGEPMPGWWLFPLVLTVLIYGLGLLGRWAIRWRLEMITGAKALVGVIRGGDDGSMRPVSPLGTDVRVAPMARSRPPPAPTSTEKKILLGILAAAALLRIPRLFASSLDLLEHTYGPGSHRIGGDGGFLEQIFMQPSAVEVTHPPLYHWLLGLLGLVGESEWIIRLPALASSLATIACVWLLFRRFRPSTGLIAAGLLAGCAPAIHFGADATPYAFVGLVLIGSILLLIRALERGSAGAWRAWVALLTVGFLCHYVTALFGLAQIGALVVVCLVRRRAMSWLGALHRALGAGLLLAPLPLAWTFVHCAWFDPVVLDTRLFADTYPSDPGLFSFMSQFAAVAAGVSPDKVSFALPLFLLAAVGWVRWLRLNRPVALVLLAILCSFAGGTFFLHSSLVGLLGGKIFWGFRWVSWIQPLLLGLAVLALVPRHPSGVVQAIGTFLGVIWLWGAGTFMADLYEHTSRPDYGGAAEAVAGELEDRDAVGTLPMWAQRGPLTSYLTRGDSGHFGEVRGVMAWGFQDRAIFLEATHEGLPFESSALNSHVDRLWILEVDETMFGRSKFSPQAGTRALRWASENLISTGPVAELESIVIHRFERPERALRWAGRKPLRLTVPEEDISSLPWLEPNMPGCDRDGGQSEGRWVMNVRIPLAEGLAPGAPEISNGQWEARQDPGHLTGRVSGGPCSEPAPVLILRPQPPERSSPL